MKKSALHPLRFTPVYKDYLWGGTRIADMFGRDTGSGICAESWEVSDRDDGMSVVAEGRLSGTPLRSLMETRAREITGEAAANGDRFPLLVKLIDAAKDLSVQVHPHDDNAAAVGGEPKSELWYLLDAADGAMLYRGFKDGVDREVLERALEGNWVEDMLARWRVQPDDAVYVPGGTVHAIGAGCLILEIQQNSNTTYRLYDWNRTGPDGKPRELHHDEAFQVIRWGNDGEHLVRPAIDLVGEGWMQERVLATPYFRVDRLTVTAGYDEVPAERGMSILFVREGGGRITSDGFEATLTPGTTWLVPAGLAGVHLEPEGDHLVLITARPPA